MMNVDEENTFRALKDQAPIATSRWCFFWHPYLGTVGQGLQTQTEFEQTHTDQTLCSLQ